MAEGNDGLVTTPLAVLGLLLAVILPSGSARSATFDFAMERNSDRITITQGSQGILAVHLALLSGSPHDVQLSASGLPSGVSVQFGDTTVRFDREGGHPPYGSTYTVKVLTSPSTPTGTYTITLTGTSGGPTRSTSFQLVVVALSGTHIYYVSTSGNDANNGSSASPFRIIQKGADMAQPGDTVVVRAGVYNEKVVMPRSGTSANRITISGEAGAIIDGNRRITGWEPAPEFASGVYKKPVSEIGFNPGSLAYEGKFCLWIAREATGSDGGPGAARRRLGLPAGHPNLNAAGCYGWEDGTTAYIRLSNDHDPDDEDVTIGGDHTFYLPGRSYITILGLTVRYGVGQIWIDGNAAGNVIEHNTIQGGQFGIFIHGDNVTDATIRNNEITMNHHYDDIGHILSADDLAYHFFVDFRKTGDRHPDFAIALEGGGSGIRIQQNHIFRHSAGINFSYTKDGLEISGNYIHHTSLYNIISDMNEGRYDIHDNLIYESTEGWRDGDQYGSVMYIYRNRFFNLTHVFASSLYSARGSDLEIYGTPAKSYIYHNSFAGNEALSLGDYVNEPGTGRPNTWVVNNIFSAENAVTNDGNNWQIHYGNNFMGGKGNYLWDLVNPSFYLSKNSDARQAGINLSRPWTMDGVRHPALPGMSPGYFSGKAPDLGVFQFGHKPTPTPTVRARKQKRVVFYPTLSRW